jgi:hypothetical protein
MRCTDDAEQKIKLWLGRQGRKEGMKENVWGTWLTRFRTPTTAAPKRLADYQFYMQHEDFKSKVTDVFAVRKGGLPAKQHMKLRTEIARELLAGEPQEVRDRIRGEAEEEHKSVLEKHEDALEGLPALDEEGLEE